MSQDFFVHLPRTTLHRHLQRAFTSSARGKLTEAWKKRISGAREAMDGAVDRCPG